MAFDNFYQSNDYYCVVKSPIRLSSFYGLGDHDRNGFIVDRLAGRAGHEHDGPQSVAAAERG